MKTISNKSFLVYYILNYTKSLNVDNISRTKAYEKFYHRFPEIKWAFLASIVSRNAGWNMTDLMISPYRTLLGEKERNFIFLTYERANWLIFSDAYPQLMIYQFSKMFNKPLFCLLGHFNVSQFMVKEWQHFWKTGDKQRLMAALIINEQQVIEKPIIQKPYFHERVFKRFSYRIQDFFHLNAVLVPTWKGELFGVYVHQFADVNKRIEIGKQVANIIFSKEHFNGVWDFVKNVEHTGSRKDYERYLKIHLPKSAAPILRMCYPVIHHNDIQRKDWFKKGIVKRSFYIFPNNRSGGDISHSYYQKKKWLSRYAMMKKIIEQL